MEKILNKNKWSSKVLGMMERIYSKAWYIGKRRELEKCKISSSRVWRKTECRSKKVRKVKYSRGRRL